MKSSTSEFLQYEHMQKALAELEADGYGFSQIVMFKRVKNTFPIKDIEASVDEYGNIGKDE